MTSAKRKFFTDGSYEQVLLAKLDRPDNDYGHSPFTKDSYLMSFQEQEPDGTDHVHDQELQQEDISIMAPALEEQEGRSLAEDDPHQLSDGTDGSRSSVEEDDDDAARSN